MSRPLPDLQLRVQAGAPLSWVRTSEPERAVTSVIETLQKIREKISSRDQEPPKLILVIPHRGAYEWRDGADEAADFVKIWPIVQSNAATGSNKMGPVPSSMEWINLLAFNKDSELEDELPFSFPQNSYIVVTEATNLFVELDATAAANTGCLARLEFRCSPPIGNLDGSPVHAMNSQESRRQIIFVGGSPNMFKSAERLSRFMHVEEFARPTVAEISEAISIECPSDSGLDISESDIQTAANMLRGLTLTETKQAVLFSIVKTKKLDPFEIRKETRRMIERHPAITMPDFRENWDNLVGLENAKSYLEAGFEPGVPAELRPRGVILTGIPGAGKSHLAKALGAKLGIPTLLINIGRVFGSLVGQTEVQLENLLQILDSIGPSVCLIDELEKAFGGMNDAAGDGGISKRVGGSFLSWMEDRTGSGIVIGTANDLTKLNSEFTRQGRWNATFFVGYPTEQQRTAIGALYCKMYNVGTNAVAKEYFAKECDQWTGSDIKDLIKTAAMFGGEKGCIEKARAYITPLYKADAEKVASIKKQGEVYTPA